MMDRRTFLTFGAKSAAIILTPGLLMPVRQIITAPMTALAWQRSTIFYGPTGLLYSKSAFCEWWAREIDDIQYRHVTK